MKKIIKIIKILTAITWGFMFGTTIKTIGETINKTYTLKDAIWNIGMFTLLILLGYIINIKHE